MPAARQVRPVVPYALYWAPTASLEDVRTMVHTVRSTRTWRPRRVHISPSTTPRRTARGLSALILIKIDFLARIKTTVKTLARRTISMRMRAQRPRVVPRAVVPGEMCTRRGRQVRVGRTVLTAVRLYGLAFSCPRYAPLSPLSSLCYRFPAIRCSTFAPGAPTLL